MLTFAKRAVITMAGLALTYWLLPTSVVGDPLSAIVLTGLVLAAFNMIVRPILSILSIPLYALTLGLGWFIVNFIILGMAGDLTLQLFGMGMRFSSIFHAALASLLISISNVVLRDLL